MWSFVLLGLRHCLGVWDLFLALINCFLLNGFLVGFLMSMQCVSCLILILSFLFSTEVSCLEQQETTLLYS